MNLRSIHSLFFIQIEGINSRLNLYTQGTNILTKTIIIWVIFKLFLRTSCWIHIRLITLSHKFQSLVVVRDTSGQDCVIVWTSVLPKCLP